MCDWQCVPRASTAPLLIKPSRLSTSAGGRSWLPTACWCWNGAENSGTAELAGYYFRNRRDATARFAIGYAEAPFNCGADPASGTPDVNYCGVVPGRSSVDISPDARGLTTDTFIGKLQLEIPIGDLQLTSVTAYVTTYNDTPPDEWDLSSTGQLLPVVKINAPDIVVRYQRANEYFSGFPTNDREWSQELRLASRQTRVRWMLGAAYSTNSSSYHNGSSTDSSRRDVSGRGLRGARDGPHHCGIRLARHVGRPFRAAGGATLQP